MITYYCIWLSSLNFHDLSYNSWLKQDIVPCVPSVYFRSQHKQISPGADELPKKMQVFAGYLCLGSVGCTQIFSTLLTLTSIEPKVGSRKGQQSSETCSPPISPPDRRRRCPFIAQVRVTRNNFNVEHGYCLLLPIIESYRPPPNTQTQTCRHRHVGVCAFVMFCLNFVQRSIKRNDL